MSGYWHIWTAGGKWYAEAWFDKRVMSEGFDTRAEAAAWLIKNVPKRIRSWILENVHMSDDEREQWLGKPKKK